MGSLNPNLLSPDVVTIIADAVDLSDRLLKRNILPEATLWALLQRQDTAGFRLVQHFVERRGVDLTRLERQLRLAVESREDKNGDLDFLLPGGGRFPISRQLIIALDEGLSIAQAQGGRAIDADHLLMALTDRRIGTGTILQQHGITQAAMQSLSEPTLVRRREVSTIIDYVEAARAGELQAVHFREDLLRDMFNVVSQTMRRHLLLLGPDGIGKRTLGYSMALLITEGKGPAGIEKFVQIDERALLDNSLETTQSAIMAARDGILFIPHIHRFFGGQKAEFPKAGQNIQKALLDNNPIIVGTTTPEDYDAHMSRVTAIAEHTQVLRVEEPSEAEAIEILRVMRSHIAADYDIDVDMSALETSAALATRYIGDIPLPRSAVHLVHRAAAMVSMNRQAQLAFKPELEDNILDSEDITLAAAQMTGIPVSKLDADERSKYARMVEHLHERIIGQNEAVLAVSRAVKTARVGLKDPRRPIGSFLFLGPSGVGKTELAKALAEFMFDDENAMLQIDMSEYMKENSVSRLIGAPPGYVGYEGGGQLTDRVREQPYIVVLFDEVEKAHPRIVDILLQVLEEGRLTDSQGRTANFSEAVVILTSNLGAEHLQVEKMLLDGDSFITEDVRAKVISSVKQEFRPEFLNRLDDITIFHPLSEQNLRDILDLMLQREVALGAERGLNIRFTAAAREWLLAQNENPEYGARPLRRIIQRNVREPLADFLLNESSILSGGITIDAGSDGLEFEPSSVAEE
jgi:ATP-dependent Clp protease ATP-binding subunit ClpC